MTMTKPAKKRPTKKTTRAKFEMLSARVEDNCTDKARTLADLISVEKGVPVRMADAVNIALNEALASRKAKK